MREQRALVQSVPPMATLPWAKHLIFLSIETPIVTDREKDYHYLFVHMKRF